MPTGCCLISRFSQIKLPGSLRYHLLRLRRLQLRLYLYEAAFHRFFHANFIFWEINFFVLALIGLLFWGDATAP